MKTKKPQRSVLMASGGLDSTVLAYWLIHRQIDFVPLFIDYGQHSHKTELETLKKVLPKNISQQINEVRLPKIYEGSRSLLVREPNLWRDRVADIDFHLPHRNLLLMSIGVAFAESREMESIYAAFIETHRAPGVDCCDGFFRLFAGLLSQSGSIKLKLPFRRFSKKQVAKIGVKVGAPIEETFSCLAASRIPCGACANCVDRLNALKSLE